MPTVSTSTQPYDYTSRLLQLGQMVRGIRERKEAERDKERQRALDRAAVAVEAVEGGSVAPDDASVLAAFNGLRKHDQDMASVLQARVTGGAGADKRKSRQALGRLFTGAEMERAAAMGQQVPWGAEMLDVAAGDPSMVGPGSYPAQPDASNQAALLRAMRGLDPESMLRAQAQAKAEGLALPKMLDPLADFTQRGVELYAATTPGMVDPATADALGRIGGTLAPTRQVEFKEGEAERRRAANEAMQRDFETGRNTRFGEQMKVTREGHQVTRGQQAINRERLELDKLRAKSEDEGGLSANEMARLIEADARFAGESWDDAAAVELKQNNIGPAEAVLVEQKLGKRPARLNKAGAADLAKRVKSAGGGVNEATMARRVVQQLISEGIPQSKAIAMLFDENSDLDPEAVLARASVGLRE